MNFMKIGRYRVNVEEAKLFGFLHPPDLFWQIGIWAEETLLDGEMVSPYAYSDDILHFRNREVTRWQDLLNEEIRWGDCYNHSLRRTNAGILLFAHDDIYNAKIKFIDIGSSNFRINWSGFVDTSAAEAFEDVDDDIEFYCEANVKFDGVLADGVSVDEALPVLQRYFSEQDFQFQHTRADGRHLFLPTEQ